MIYMHFVSYKCGRVFVERIRKNNNVKTGVRTSIHTSKKHDTISRKINGKILLDYRQQNQEYYY